MFHEGEDGKIKVRKAERVVEKHSEDAQRNLISAVKSQSRQAGNTWGLETVVVYE